MRRMSPIARSGPTAATYAAGACTPTLSNSSRARSSPTSATSAARSRSGHDVDSSSMSRSSASRSTTGRGSALRTLIAMRASELAPTSVSNVRRSDS